MEKVVEFLQKNPVQYLATVGKGCIAEAVQRYAQSNIL